MPLYTSPCTNHCSESSRAVGFVFGPNELLERAGETIPNVLFQFERKSEPINHNKYGRRCPGARPFNRRFASRDVDRCVRRSVRPKINQSPTPPIYFHSCIGRKSICTHREHGLGTNVCAGRYIAFVLIAPRRFGFYF